MEGRKNWKKGRKRERSTSTEGRKREGKKIGGKQEVPNSKSERAQTKDSRKGGCRFTLGKRIEREN